MEMELQIRKVSGFSLNKVSFEKVTAITNKDSTQ